MITIRWVRGVDKQDSTCIMEFLLCTINNNLMLSQNIPFHHKMIIYLNTKMFFLLFSYAYSEICSRENEESFMLSATSYLLWPPLLIAYNASHFDMHLLNFPPEVSRYCYCPFWLLLMILYSWKTPTVLHCHFVVLPLTWHVKSNYKNYLTVKSIVI